jgi:hypothetical protein
MVLAISVTAIFLALVLQFNNSIKPFLVFAAVPYGVVGSLTALFIMREAFGFMAFLGIASLVGVIVSHVIVLFDFIELKHEEGEPFEDSLLDAGIARLRPVLITVGATILALFPLAIHGGPLWQPLCYAQIGGLALATVIELLLLPVFYAVFVLDLKIIKWGRSEAVTETIALNSLSANCGYAHFVNVPQSGNSNYEGTVIPNLLLTPCPRRRKGPSCSPARGKLSLKYENRFLQFLILLLISDNKGTYVCNMPGLTPPVKIPRYARTGFPIT